LYSHSFPGGGGFTSGPPGVIAGLKDC